MCITLDNYIFTVTTLVLAAILEYICVALSVISTICTIEIGRRKTMYLNVKGKYMR